VVDTRRSWRIHSTGVWGTVDLVCLGGGELGGNRGELQLGVDSVVEPGAACAPTI